MGRGRDAEGGDIGNFARRASRSSRSSGGVVHRRMARWCGANLCTSLSGRCRGGDRSGVRATTTAPCTRSRGAMRFAHASDPARMRPDVCGNDQAYPVRLSFTGAMAGDEIFPTSLPSANGGEEGRACPAGPWFVSLRIAGGAAAQNFRWSEPRKSRDARVRIELCRVARRWVWIPISLDGSGSASRI